MARLDRDTILDALLERLEESPPASQLGYRECTRKEVGWERVKKPGLQLVTKSEERDDLGQWTIDVDVIVTVDIKDTDESPERTLRAYVDAIDAALDARGGEPTGYAGRTTLGGRCESVRISGAIDLTQGVLSNVGEVEIPMQIVAYEPGAQD